MAVGKEERKEEPDHRDRGELCPKAEPGRGVPEGKRPRRHDQRLHGVLAGEEGQSEAQRRDAEHPTDHVSWLAAQDERADHGVREHRHGEPKLEKPGAADVRPLEGEARDAKDDVPGDDRPADDRGARNAGPARKDRRSGGCHAESLRAGR